MSQNKFCIKCGHERSPHDKVCTQCGTKFDSDKQERASSKNKIEDIIEQQKMNSKILWKYMKNLTKKQLIIISTITSIVAILIITTLFLRYYYSENAVEERFLKNVESNNLEEIVSDVTTVSNRKITLVEASAYTTLMNNDNSNLNNSYYVEAYSEILGIIPRYKVVLEEQNIFYSGNSDGLNFFMEKENLNSQSNNDEESEYGPYIFGEYTIEAKLNNEFGTSTKKFKLIIPNLNESSIDLNDYFSADLLTINLNGYDKEIMSNPMLIVDDKKIKINDPTTIEYGPMVIDGEKELQITANTPWGEITSQKLLAESDLYFNLIALPKNQEKIALQVIKNYIEQYYDFYTSGQKRNFKNVTKSYQSKLNDEFTNSDMNYKLNSVSINQQLSSYDENTREVVIPVAIDLEYRNNIEGEWQQEVEQGFFGLLYDENAKSWLINSYQYETTGDEEFEATQTIEGSKKIYGQSSEEQELKTIVEETLNNAYEAFVSAINNNDFSIVEDYYVKNGKSYNENKKYIPATAKRGITEEFLGLEIENIKKINDNQIKVTSKDQYRINSEKNGEYDAKFQSVTILKKVDEKWLIDELVSTEKIEE